MSNAIKISNLSATQNKSYGIAEIHFKFSRPMADNETVGMKLRIFSFVFLFMSASATYAGVSLPFGVCDPNGANCSTQDSSGSANSEIMGPPAPVPPRARIVNEDVNGNSKNSEGGNSSNNGNSNQTNSSSEGSATNVGSYDACAAQAESLIRECSAKSDGALSKCETEGNSSLSSSMGMASQMATGMSTSSPSASGACSNMGMLGASAQAGLAAYQTACSMAKNSCMDSCSDARKSMAECAAQSGMSLYQIQSTDSYREVSSNYSRCSSQQAKVDQAGTALANIMSETEKAKECQAQVAAMNTPSSDPNSAYCKAHPNVASCILNCNHPTMVNNQTCICMKSPFDPSCGGASASGSVAGPFNAMGGGSQKVKKDSESDILGQDSFDPSRLNAIGEAARKNMGQPGEENGGRQGGSANFGNSAADSGTSGKPGSGPIDAPASTAVNGGFYASGGGGGGAGGGSGSGDGTGGQYGAMAANGARGPGTPDLRQFLPGGALDPSRRGIAGINGVDGISGPNETNWVKMQRRYRVLETTFLP